MVRNRASKPYFSNPINIILQEVKRHLVKKKNHWSRPSYSLKIPRGAIREGEEVNIHTGIIACAGSNRFKVPKNYQVVSPVVWFCRDREEEFQELVTIELQHCAQYGQCLTVLKEKCSDLSDVFVFEPQGEVQPQGDYATFQTKHFCIYCYGIVTEVPQRICVVPVEGAYVGQRKEVTFCFCYFLDGCLRVRIHTVCFKNLHSVTYCRLLVSNTKNVLTTAILQLN